MKPTYFIAKRFHSFSSDGLHYAKPIVNIATAGVAMGIVIMLFSIAIANGFKSEISNNVAAANAHFKISPLGFNEKPDLFIDNSNEKLEAINAIPEVKLAFAAMYQPVLLEGNEEIYGLVLKGIDRELPEDFYQYFMLEGQLPTEDKDLCLSKSICNKLELQIGDAVNIYITNSGKNLKRRRLKLSGIFETGVPGIDEEMAYAHIDQLRALNSVNPSLSITRENDSYLIANSLGAPMNISFKEESFQETEFKIPADSKEEIKVSVRNKNLYDSLHFVAATGDISFREDSRATLAHSIEVYTQDFSQLNLLEDKLIAYTPFDARLVSIQEDFPEVFNWLNLLDTNVLVLLIIMAVVSLINMASALLVLIIEKTNAIALLKTMGAENKLIRRVFLQIAGLILSKGLLIGNLIALPIMFSQKYFGWIPLEKSQYYVSQVPIEINLFEILGINLATLIFCLIVLILPTILIARIYPAKALRIE